MPCGREGFISFHFPRKQKISELASQAGVRYNNGPNTVTYFGALVCNGKDLDALFAME